MPFKPALNITDQIADYLGDQIVQGELAPGARIQELKVAQRLSVSRGSIREALLILERRHLIEVVPRKGALVNDISAVEATDIVDMLAVNERRWFLRLLAKMHSPSVALNASASPVMIGVDAAVEAMEVAAREGDAIQLINARTEFYNAALKSANRYVSAAFECLLPSHQRILWVLIAQERLDLHDVARYYRALLAALASDDGDRIVQLLKAFAKRIRDLSIAQFGGDSSECSEALLVRSHQAAGRPR